MYKKAIFAVRPAMADDAAGLLIAWGALGCAVEHVSRFGLVRGPVARLQAWFAHLSPEDLRRIHGGLRDFGMTANGAVPEVANQSDPGWATMWMDRFAPLPVGRRLLIVPPWNTAVNSERIRLVIQPGQGFGTGHHPTTAGALRTIENLCGTAPPTEALDVGTGSGVLAIAMRLYGVKHVVAIDNDPAALENARENAGLNLIHAVRFSSARLKSFRRRFDLVTANILSSTLIAMAPDLIGLVKPGGHLILGGILARERGAVLNHYRPKMRLVRSRIDRGWATLVMER